MLPFIKANINIVNSHNRTFLNLQIFRGLAAILVLLSHANLLVDKTLLNGLLVIGRSGVDFFFVLSGFIIYYVNYGFIGDPTKFVIYIKKRFNRVYPIYWIYTLITLGIHFVLMNYTQKSLIYWIKVDLQNITKSVSLYPVNVALKEAPIIPVAWTLSFEIVFYAMFSLLIIFKPKLSIPIATTWIAAVIFNAIGFFHTDNILMNVILSIKNIEFFLGCLAAHLLRNYSIKIPKYLPSLLLSIGVILIGISWWYNVRTGYIYSLIHKTDVITFGIPFFIIVLSAVLLEEKENHAKKGRLKSFLVYLGDASYSIYLTHFISLILVNATLVKVFSLNSPTIFLISFITATIMGCLSYTLIEKPLLNWLNNESLKTSTKSNRTLDIG